MMESKSTHDRMVAWIAGHLLYIALFFLLLAVVSGIVMCVVAGRIIDQKFPTIYQGQ